MASSPSSGDRKRSGEARGSASSGERIAGQTPLHLPATGLERVAPGLDLGAQSAARVHELAERLPVYRASYYAGKPLVSDAAYDALEDELRALAPAHPLLAQVGTGQLVEAWEKARHEIPMGSLNKVVSEQELLDWIARCNELLAPAALPPIDDDLCVVEKLDGISVELLYREGVLVDAITRGDGEVGERITANVRLMRGAVPKIAHVGPLSVRGEIILRLSDAREHFPDVTSSRNAAAGIARRFDGQGCGQLTVLVYDLLGDIEVATEVDKLAALASLGFATPNAYRGRVGDVLEAYRRYGAEIRSTLDYEIDGLVVRANRLATAGALGELNHRPRGAVAFKFASPVRVSRVREIRWDTGPSGRVTPVAVVEPVQLAGASVQRASLHNASRVRALDIGVGDEVLVSRRNDVIPYVEEVVAKHGPAAVVPERCPRCAELLLPSGEYLLCRNDACPALVEGRLRSWVDAIGALEWGDRLVQQIVSEGLAREPAELYSLTVEGLAALDFEAGEPGDKVRKMGRKRATKALAELKAPLPLSLPVFLAALGIEGFGQQTARLLVDAGYRELPALLDAQVPELCALKGLGELKAAAIVTGLARRRGEIERLLAAGLGPAGGGPAGPLSGRTFCITGTHSRARKELVALIERAGGQVLATVSRGLDYLVIADPTSSSSKAVTARRYGTRLLSEAELLELLTPAGAVAGEGATL